MRKLRVLMSVLFLMLIGSLTGVIYAAEDVQGTNATEGTYTKNGKTYECIYSANDKGYLQITQIVPNSQNVKISTYVDDNKLLIGGVVNKGTVITIEVLNEGSEDSETYTVTSTGTFSQPLEIKKGMNKIYISYANKKEDVNNHIMIKVKKVSDESIIAIKSYLVTA